MQPKTLLLFITSIAIGLFLSPSNVKAWSIQVDVFVRDINGNMMIDVPVDHDSGYTGADPYPGTNSYCHQSNCQLPACDPNNPGLYAAAFRQNNQQSPPSYWQVWDVSPGPPSGAFRTVDVNLVSPSDPRFQGSSVSRNKGAWTTIRTGWGFDFNCNCSPLKETLDLTEPSFASYEVDHIEGDVYMPLNGIKYTCKNNGECDCSDDRPGFCNVAGFGTGGCNAGAANPLGIKNIEGCSFIKDPNSNKYWTHAYAMNGFTTSTEFVLKIASPRPGKCGLYDGTSRTLTEMNAATQTNLCDKGTPNPTSFSGNGPWSWTCSGLFGGSDQSCSATNPSTISESCSIFIDSNPPVFQGEIVTLNWILNLASLPTSFQIKQQQVGSPPSYITVANGSNDTGFLDVMPLKKTDYTIVDSSGNNIPSCSLGSTATVDVRPHQSGTENQAAPPN